MGNVLNACMIKLHNKLGSALLELVPSHWAWENHPEMFGLRVDLSVLEMFTKPVIMLHFLIWKGNRWHTQRNSLFCISFGAAFFILSGGELHSVEYLTIPSRPLQRMVCIIKGKGSGLETSKWLDVVVPIHLLYIHSCRGKEDPQRKSLSQIKSSEQIQYKAINFDLFRFCHMNRQLENWYTTVIGLLLKLNCNLKPNHIRIFAYTMKGDQLIKLSPMGQKYHWVHQQNWKREMSGKTEDATWTIPFKKNLQVHSN